MTIKERFNKWKAYPLSEDLRKELEAYDEDQINDAFYCDLEFGTAGMRGVLGPGSNRLNIFIVRKATVGFAKYLLQTFSNAKEMGVVIAHDNRLYSREFTLESARVLSSFGIKTYIFDSLRPTPELSFAVRKAKACGGIMITASHNPKEYNGYKVYDETGCQLVPHKIKSLVEIIGSLGDELDVEIGNEEPGEIITLGQEYDDDFVSHVESIQLNSELDKKDFKIVFSPQHGTSYVNAKKIFADLGYNVIDVVEQCNPDPLFSGTISPNPEEKSAYVKAIEYAVKNDADLILTTDPDADRVGIAFKNSLGEYELYTGNQTGSLIIDYIFSQRRAKGLLSRNGVMFNTIVTSSLGAKIANSYGVEVESLLTGFKFIGDKIHQYEMSKEKTFEFGYEESYGYLVKPFARDKDALQALVIISEMVNYHRLKGFTLDQVMDRIQKEYGYHQDELYSIYFKGQSGLKVMKDLMQSLRTSPLKEVGEYKVVAYEDYLLQKRVDLKGNETKIDLPTSDVLKFFFEDGSTLAIRPSGTEPKCKFYYGAVGKTKEEVISKPSSMHKTLLELLKIEA